jgi:nascent polypeptide-associated complex subunit alpha
MMFPGMKGVNPKKLQQQLKKMGVETEELEDVREVIIRLPNKDLILEHAEVTVISVGDVKTYQIRGESTEKLSVSEEDVKLVAEQSGATEEMARNALIESKGDLAEAILQLAGSKQ